MLVRAYNYYFYTQTGWIWIDDDGDISHTMTQSKERRLPDYSNQFEPEVMLLYCLNKSTTNSRYFSPVVHVLIACTVLLMIS